MEPLMDCNLPELLAVDLETSGRPPRPSKPISKTTRPTTTTERKRAKALQELSLGAIASPRERDLMSKMKSLELLDRKYAELLALGEELMKEASDSDESTSDSSGYVEPPSIRTRNLSVTTPATSVASGRKFSGSTFTSASASPQLRNPAKSWLDSEEESIATSTDRTAGTVMLEPRVPIISPPRRSSARYAQRHDSFKARSRMAELYASDPFANFGDSADSEDDTVTALPSVRLQQETPATRKHRIDIDNLKVPSSRDRSMTSRRRGNGSPRSPPSPSSFIPPTANPDDTPTRTQPWQSRHQRPKLPELVMPQRQADDIKEYDESHDDYSDVSHVSEEKGMSDYPDDTSHHNESIETWFRTIIDEFAPSFEPEIEAPISKIPLPSDVLETLRVSVSCFPETMLLCSSLSIETIRSHARKVKYEGKGRADLSSVSNLSLNADEKSKSSTWKKLTSIARKTPTANVVGSRHIDMSANQASVYTTNFGLENQKQTWPDPNPDWASIKNVFPNGTDYLCDALYAHLLTYNYIDTLCPRNVSPTASQFSRPQTAHDTASSIALNGSPCGQSNARIPRKAASLLGLHNSLQEDEEIPPVPTLPDSRPRRSSVSSTISRANTVGTGRNILRNKRSYVRPSSKRSEGGISTPPIPQTPSTLGGRRSFVGTAPGTPTQLSMTNRTRQRGTNLSAGTGVSYNGDNTMPKLTSAEQSLVDLRAGLVTCITRLIAALQMTSSGGGGDNSDVDAILALTGEDSADLDADGNSSYFYNNDVGRGSGMRTSRDYQRLGHHYNHNHNNRNGRDKKKHSNNSINHNGSGSVNGRGVPTVEPFLMRSLCELVRVNENRERDIGI